MYVLVNTRSESNEENKLFFKPYGTTCTFKINTKNSVLYIHLKYQQMHLVFKIL